MRGKPEPVAQATPLTFFDFLGSLSGSFCLPSNFLSTFQPSHSLAKAALSMSEADAAREHAIRRPRREQRWRWRTMIRPLIRPIARTASLHELSNIKHVTYKCISVYAPST